MTSSDRRYCLFLLKLAKQGEAHACERLVEEIAHHYGYMIRRFSSVDPAYDRDDLRAQFQSGIWQAITKVDGRGDPLYHLAWRGYRAVGSMLNAIKQRRYGTAAWIEEFGERSLGTLPEGWDPPDTRSDFDPVAVLETNEARAEARRQVAYLLSHTHLTPRQREVVAFIMGDPEPDGSGANMRLAQTLGVSAQAASQHRKAVAALLSGLQESKGVFHCLACGRDFRSRGALTQHRNGQSGHRGCVGEQSVAAT